MQDLCLAACPVRSNQCRHAFVFHPAHIHVFWPDVILQEILLCSCTPEVVKSLPFINPTDSNPESNIWELSLIVSVFKRQRHECMLSVCVSEPVLTVCNILHGLQRPPYHVKGLTEAQRV